MHVLGRRGDESEGPVAELGRYRARDGSRGAPVGLDLDRPHATLVVGKRGYGKSYTLGVLGEELAAARGLAPVLVDPVGALAGLGRERGRVIDSPTIRAGSVPPRAWPGLVGLDPEGAAGGLVWRAASRRGTLAGMCDVVDTADAAAATRRVARNHLDLAHSWDVFDPSGLEPTALADGEVTVLDCSRQGRAATGAVVGAVARGLYAGGVEGELDRLPWLVVDEAHVVTDGVAGTALRTLLTRGRAPGVSLVLATQRPGALPAVAVSQADLVVSHRLTAERDVAALSACEATYLQESLRQRLPEGRGEAVVVDDATESIHEIRVRERETPHTGESPRASAATERTPDPVASE